MILVSPPYRTNWGVFSRLRHDPREVTRPVAGRPSMFVLRSMRNTQRFCGRFGKYSRTGAVKLLITRRRASRLSSSGYRSRLQPVPAAATGCDPAPLQKDDSTLRLGTLLSSCLRGQCRLTLWGTLDARAEPTWPAQAFSSIAAMYLCWPALLRRPLACALDSAQT